MGLVKVILRNWLSFMNEFMATVFDNCLDLIFGLDKMEIMLFKFRLLHYFCKTPIHTFTPKILK